jgi:hypothetical protein
MPEALPEFMPFTFEQYGPRVPAVVISAWIPKDVVDHRLYDHSSIPVTLEEFFGLICMTARDNAANAVLQLLLLLPAHGYTHQPARSSEFPSSWDALDGPCALGCLRSIDTIQVERLSQRRESFGRHSCCDAAGY